MSTGIAETFLTEAGKWRVRRTILILYVFVGLITFGFAELQDQSWAEGGCLTLLIWLFLAPMSWHVLTLPRSKDLAGGVTSPSSRDVEKLLRPPLRTMIWSVVLFISGVAMYLSRSTNG